MQKDALYQELENALRKELRGEVRFDKLSKILYSTDASNYKIEPIGLVIPKTVQDVIATIRTSANYDVPILPRGGGTSLTGQSIGHALIIDFSKYLNKVIDVDRESRTARVEPGIYIDNLNHRLREHGLMFGPDPSSSKVATLGGVVGTNATGAHSILYGMAGDNVLASKTISAGGELLDLHAVTKEEISSKSKGGDTEALLYGRLQEFRNKYAGAIEKKFPRHWRRASGYSLNYMLEEPFNPAKLLSGSEGTLAVQSELTLKLEPIPQFTGLTVLEFEHFLGAMESVPFILEQNPSAIELIDRVLIDLTRDHAGFLPMLSFVEGNPEAILAVEFYGANEKETGKKARGLIDALRKRNTRFKGSVALKPEDQLNVWNVRKAGLGLLVSKRDEFKPIACIEDVSVPVDKLPEYAYGIKELTKRLGTRAAFYGHASAGCLHVRPFVNLKTSGGVRIMEELTEGALKLTEKLGGVMSGEHGDGIQRSYLNERLFGEELYEAIGELKSVFDPEGRLNPGKIVEPLSPTENLRYGPSYKTIKLKTYLDWSQDRGFDGAVEMCNGQGICRKLGEGVMCPSYKATHDEKDTTRARANALREVLSGTLTQGAFTSPEMHGVYELCISCKACKTECPSKVDAGKMKLEFLSHYNKTHGLSLRRRLFGHIHDLSKYSSNAPKLSNLMIDNPITKTILSKMGITFERSLPLVSSEDFIAWFNRRNRHAINKNGKKLVYFHDTWASYYTPEVGKAAVRLLEAAGYQVIIEEKRVCCGRPMLSEGMVEEARGLAWRNVSTLLPYVNEGIPIVGTEPSCILAFRDEYLYLLPEDKYARALAGSSYLLGEFLYGLHKKDGLNIKWKDKGPRVLYHAHCHERSMLGDNMALELLGLSGCGAERSGAGCCGMAGGFGYESEHYGVSRAIGQDRLFPKVKETTYDTVVAVSGFSCGHQIEHFTGRKTKHLSVVLADQLIDS